MKNDTRSMILLSLIVLAIATIVPVNAVWPAHSGVKYPQTVWSDAGATGSVTGRVVTPANGTLGLGHAYVAVVNASNVSQQYYNSTSDAYGNYAIARINATYSPVLRQGPDGTPGTYDLGRSMYKVYANLSPYGEGYSDSFGIDANMSGSIVVSVVIFAQDSYGQSNGDSGSNASGSSNKTGSTPGTSVASPTPTPDWGENAPLNLAIGAIAVLLLAGIGYVIFFRKH